MHYLKLKYIIFICLIFLLISCKNEGLNIDNDEEIKIVQRGSKVIEGSEGNIELKIGDITAGSTEVIIEGIETGKIYYKNHLGRGEAGIFKYGMYYYRIKINKFEEHIFHDDYAFITFHSVSEERGKSEAQPITDKKETIISPDEIRNHFIKIKTSGLNFIRNGIIWPDSVMALHLENKYKINSKDIKTKEDFIIKIVKVSSMTGEAYKVIENNNDTINLVDWLNLQH